MKSAEFEELIVEAETAPVQGWDFSWLGGRVAGAEPSWSYPELVRPRVAGADRLLDIDTGGGELLASLGPLPSHAWATEGWAPNIPVARRRLEPLGVTVLPVTGEELPLPDACVDLVLNCHGRMPASEIRRVLRPGGVLLTQQVGGEDCTDLNEALGAPPRGNTPDSWGLRAAREALTAAGLRVTDAREERPVLTFHDVGALVYHLRLVTWQVPDFTPQRYERPLRRVHEHIRAHGRLDVQAHRFLVCAERP